MKSQDKGISLYLKTTAGVLRLLNHHSKSEKEQTQRQCKPKDTEITFVQGDEDGPRGFGNRKGNCCICGKAGHHAWECPKKDKDRNDDTKKDRDKKKQPGSKTETGKNKTGTTLATHGSSTNDEYDGEDERENECMHARYGYI